MPPHAGCIRNGFFGFTRDRGRGKEGNRAGHLEAMEEVLIVDGFKNSVLYFPCPHFHSFEPAKANLEVSFSIPPVLRAQYA